MTQEDRNVLAELRLKKAGDTLTEAADNISLGHWRVAANRLYYACFYAANALLVQKGITAHTHSGVQNQLGLHFVKTGFISAEQNDLYYKLLDLRQTGDYDDWGDVQEKDVVHLVEPARNFVGEVEKIIRLSQGTS